MKARKFYVLLCTPVAFLLPSSAICQTRQDSGSNGLRPRAAKGVSQLANAYDYLGMADPKKEVQEINDFDWMKGGFDALISAMNYIPGVDKFPLYSNYLKNMVNLDILLARRNIEQQNAVISASQSGNPQDLEDLVERLNCMNRGEATCK